jgi:hypothetical protein
VRQAAEASLREKGQNVPFPGWGRLGVESLESAPRVMILVSDSDNKPVRWVKGSHEKGAHRVNWDLRMPAPDAVDLTTPEFIPPWAGTPRGPLAAPGVYSAQLFALTGDQVLPLGKAQGFVVKPVRTSPDGTDYAKVASYQQETATLLREIANAREELGRTSDLLRHMKAAAEDAPRAAPSLFARLDNFGAELSKLGTRLSGDQVRGRLNETSSPSIGGRAYNAANTWRTTHAATATQRADLEIAKTDFAAFSADLDALLTNDLARLEADLSAAGAPSWR